MIFATTCTAALAAGVELCVPGKLQMLPSSFYTMASRTKSGTTGKWKVPSTKTLTGRNILTLFFMGLGVGRETFWILQINQVSNAGFKRRMGLSVREMGNSGNDASNSQTGANQLNMLCCMIASINYKTQPRWFKVSPMFSQCFFCLDRNWYSGYVPPDWQVLFSNESIRPVSLRSVQFLPHLLFLFDFYL